MITPSIPAALQEKNEQEFVEVTRRIQDALAQIESDSSLKATQDVLAKLADCSRGTLNNRKWPLEQLLKIKAARKASINVKVSETSSAAKEESRIERYKQQLYDSREEVLVWKARYDDGERKLKQALHINRILTERLKAAEGELSKQRSASTAKIVKISSKRPQ